MRPDRKARRPRISSNIRGRSNDARRDAAPAECRHHFHHGLLVSNEPTSTLVERRLRYIERQRALQRDAAARDARTPHADGHRAREPSRHAAPADRPARRCRTGRCSTWATRPTCRSTRWRLEVGGLCENPLSLSWDDFLALPQVDDVSDFHCVTTWSRMDNRWRGVRFRTLAELAVPARRRHASCSCTGYDRMPGTTIPYTTNLALARAVEDDVLLVHTWEGAPLPREHGGPCRMITPKLYAWKGTKWIRRIEFLAEDDRGFWEERGYSNTAEPWLDDRYSRRAPALPRAFVFTANDLRPMLATLARGAAAARRPSACLRAEVRRHPRDRAGRARAAAARAALVAQRQREDARSSPSSSRRCRHWAGTLDGPVVLDGEIVALDDAGVPPASSACRAASTSRCPATGRRRRISTPERAADGVHRLRSAARRRRSICAPLPLRERRAALEARCARTCGSPLLRLSRQVAGDGRALYARADAEGWEGLIVKRAAVAVPRPASAAPSGSKLKIQQQDEFVVGGWTEPRGARRHFGALILGALAPPTARSSTWATSAPGSPAPSSNAWRRCCERARHRHVPVRPAAEDAGDRALGAARSWWRRCATPR